MSLIDDAKGQGKAALGAAIGTVIPGLGTAAGAVVGELVDLAGPLIDAIGNADGKWRDADGNEITELAWLNGRIPNSGDMAGVIESIKLHALHQAIQRLSPEDRARVLSFNPIFYVQHMLWLTQHGYAPDGTDLPFGKAMRDAWVANQVSAARKQITVTRSATMARSQALAFLSTPAQGHAPPPAPMPKSPPPHVVQAAHAVVASAMLGDAAARSYIGTVTKAANAGDQAALVQAAALTSAAADHVIYKYGHRFGLV